MKFLNLMFLLACVSCSTIHQVSISSGSTTGAIVTAEGADGKVRLIGATPLNVGDAEIFDSSADAVYLKIRKDGYADQGILISRGGASDKIEVNVRLEPLKVTEDKLRSNENQEQLIRSILIAHRYVSNKQYNKAERLLIKLIESHPYLSVPYDFLGNINYIRGNSREALSLYLRSASVNPGNPETQHMIKKLSGNIKDIK